MARVIFWVDLMDAILVRIALSDAMGDLTTRL